ncbi:killer toxin resistant protein [Microbotryomycetes sp. JL201]|nr:killer toxin resistant protein [Microbotryomycetes sp. JL201]
MPSRRRSATWLWLCVAITACQGAASEPAASVSSRVQASWPAAPLVVQYLHTLALEQGSDALFDVLAYATLDAVADDTGHLATLTAASQSLLGQITPVSPSPNWMAMTQGPTGRRLLANETLTLLQDLVAKAGILQGNEVQTKATMDSLQLSLAARETSVVIAGMAELEAERKRQLEPALDDCDTWIDLGSKAVCSEQEFWQTVGADQKTSQGPLRGLVKSRIYPFDHQSPRGREDLPVVVLYAAPTSPLGRDRSFSALFRFLHKLAKSSSGGNRARIRLVLRWSNAGSGPKLLLSGYGGSLDIKKSDYLAIDDRQTEGKPETDASRTGSVKIEPVKKNDISTLALRTATIILKSDDPLQAFVNVTSSFPATASRLSELVPAIEDELVQELSEFQSMSPLGQRPTFHINGMYIPEKSVEPLALMRILRKERKLVSSIQSLVKGMTPKAARSILTDESISAASSGAPARGNAADLTTEVLGDLFDAGDLEEGGGLILWWNDIETDKKYKSWPRSFQELLRPVYPGQMNLVRRNLNNVVFVLDLSQPSNLMLLAENVRQFVSRGVPIRFGFVPQTRVDETSQHISDAVARTIWYLVDKLASYGKQITMDSLARSYSAVRAKQEQELASFELVVKSAEYDNRLAQARQYGKRLAVQFEDDEDHTKSHFFLNGAHYPLDEDWMQNLQRALSSHIQFLQQAVYVGQLDDLQDANRFFYDQSTTHKRRNPFIFPSEQQPLRIINLAEAEGQGSAHSNFFGPGMANASVYLFTDLETPQGRQLAINSLKTLSETSSYRLTTVHNPVRTDQASNCFDLAQSSNQSIDRAIDILKSGNLPSDEPTHEYFKACEERVVFARSIVRAGENALVVNGRIVGPFRYGELTSDDLPGLVAFESRKRIAPVVEALERSGVNMPDDDRANVVNMLTSVISEAYMPDPAAGLFGGISTERRRDWSRFELTKSSLMLGDDESALFEIAVFVDPATELAQRWSQIMYTLAKQDAIFIRLYLNPALRLAELPIKRFYDFTFDATMQFDPLTGDQVDPELSFRNIPEDTLLTFAADLPNSWLAFPIESVHDLDNIRLGDLSARQRKQGGVRALFELESLVVEGHAREMPAGAAPRGLQLELLKGTTESSTKRGDTTVMANLGYFQLKANPGPWRLSIRPGKSSEVYSFESIGAQGWASGDLRETGDSLFVLTLEGLTLYPRLKRNPGYEAVNLLDETEGSTANAAGVVKKFKNMIPFFGSKAVAKKQADINVFTVASGLLYERMAFLMMVSVMKHTKSTVKFWFIQNFLSPSFRAFVPHMAKEYGFEYEMITYKWPHWLRAQKEKQRTIWGYKILFLDVLFPLELERVIFIVRTDLKQLIDMDIGGAPYAYAPMGDDRPEMEGFRFWKTGYWKEHLRNKPYHISALYLVDLDRFRRIAAGDRLRQQYQGLSADPNSLANLDQDLPNNLQHNLPIFTLDKSWLWCETWCSDESLTQAKTIDLCNNPLTHEPKLQRAKRLIPEWTVYDDEVAALAKRVATQATSSSFSDASVQKDEMQVNDVVGVFGQTADELEQAKEQSQEQDEFVQQKQDRDELTSMGRVKDEL